MTTDPQAPDQQDPHGVQIRQERLAGPVEIVLDDHDVSQDVMAIHLDLSAADKVPYIVLELSPAAGGGGFSFDGMARVAVGEPLDPGPAAAAFLAAMDWEQLEQAALNRPDLDSGRGALTRAMLAQLTEWAHGRA